MKKVFCPKCDNLTTFDETKYPVGKPIPLVCAQCGSQFNVKLGKKKVQAPSGSERQLVEQDFSNGYISVIANFFGDKQEFGLQLGDNVIGRRNRDTDGVDIAIINTDPSMGRKHCVINVKKNAVGKLIYTLRDFPSLTGTFLNNVCLGKKEQVVLNHGAVITLGATTFILHYPEGQEEEEMMY